MANETMNLNTPILTLDSDTVLETAQSKADLIWHDIQNAYRTRKILTGILGGIEKTEAGSLIAIIYYKDYRAVIPISEMMINLIQDETHDYGDLSLRQNKVLNNMLGCEIDFVIKGLDAYFYRINSYIFKYCFYLFFYHIFANVLYIYHFFSIFCNN